MNAWRALTLSLFVSTLLGCPGAEPPAAKVAPAPATPPPASAPAAPKKGNLDDAKVDKLIGEALEAEQKGAK